MKVFLALVTTMAIFACVGFSDDANAGAAPPYLQQFTKTIDVASLATLVGETDTVAAPGAALGDSCDVGAGAVDMAGVVAYCYIAAANIATIRFFNSTAGTVNLASQTYTVYLQKKNPFG